MALLPTWPPPPRELWAWTVFVFQFFPVVTVFQWMGVAYPAGKTSVVSRLNLPGKAAWMSMELPGLAVVLYCLATIRPAGGPPELPPAHAAMAALFVIHYIYRALLGPLLNPSMSPIHVKVWLSAILFQLMNGLSIGGYLAGYGPPAPAKGLSESPGAGSRLRMCLGIAIWSLGFLGNIFHDDVLREIRRAERRNQRKKISLQLQKRPGTGMAEINVEKLYRIPKRGLFSWVLFPHYLCEWIEWAGWWMIGGSSCVPARTFLINEITTMTPRAIQGKDWYIQQFGTEKLADIKAIIPGIL